MLFRKSLISLRNCWKALRCSQEQSAIQSRLRTCGLLRRLRGGRGGKAKFSTLVRPISVVIGRPPIKTNRISGVFFVFKANGSPSVRKCNGCQTERPTRHNAMVRLKRGSTSSSTSPGNRTKPLTNMANMTNKNYKTNTNNQIQQSNITTTQAKTDTGFLE